MEKPIGGITRMPRKRSQDWRGWYVNDQRRSRCRGSRDVVIVATRFAAWSPKTGAISVGNETTRPIPWLPARKGVVSRPFNRDSTAANVGTPQSW